MELFDLAIEGMKALDNWRDDDGNLIYTDTSNNAQTIVKAITTPQEAEKLIVDVDLHLNERWARELAGVLYGVSRGRGGEEFAAAMALIISACDGLKMSLDELVERANERYRESSESMEKRTKRVIAEKTNAAKNSGNPVVLRWFYRDLFPDKCHELITVYIDGDGKTSRVCEVCEDINVDKRGCAK